MSKHLLYFFIRQCNNSWFQTNITRLQGFKILLFIHQNFEKLGITPQYYDWFSELLTLEREKKISCEKVEEFFNTIFSDETEVDVNIDKRKDEIVQLRDFISQNDFSSLQLFLFFFGKLLSLLKKNHIHPIMIVEAVFSQTNKDVVAWLMENGFANPGNLLQNKHDFYTDEKSIDVLSTIINITIENDKRCYFNDIRNFFLCRDTGNVNRGQQLFRCCVRKICLEELTFSESKDINVVNVNLFSALLKIQKKLLTEITSEISQYISCPDIVHIILLNF